MSQFLFAYHGTPEVSSEEEGQALMNEWREWISQAGDAMVSPGNPLGQSYTVSAEGVEDHGGANPLMGYSIVEVASLEDALALAEGCPHAHHGGSIEVAEIKEMS